MAGRKVGILAIGTEVTDGQIVNQNSSWLARSLVDLGFQVQEHRSVPDERSLMSSALRELCELYDWVFVTGGLGPTSDDFTRDVVAEVVAMPLKFDQSSWLILSDKLKSRGVPVGDLQRQQCFFPDGSEILENPAGTANGFRLDFVGSRIVVLPGPPNEILAIWNEHLRAFLEGEVPEKERTRLHIWRCLGKGEGELAEIVEAVMRDSDLVIGYRAHTPYVEVKVWVLSNDSERARPYLERLESVLTQWLVNRDGEDVFDIWIDWALKQGSLTLYDAATAGRINQRIREQLLARKLMESSIGIETHLTLKTSGDSRAWVAKQLAGPRTGLEVAVAADVTGRVWILGYKFQEKVVIEEILPPYIYSLLTERGRSFISEKIGQVIACFLVEKMTKQDS